MGKRWLKIGSRVQLKSDESSDGKIIASHGKGNWTVAWEHSEAQSRHHSRGLKEWTFAAPLSDSSDSDDAEISGGDDSENEALDPQDAGAEKSEQKKNAFDKSAKSLEGKKVANSGGKRKKRSVPSPGIPTFLCS